MPLVDSIFSEESKLATGVLGLRMALCRLLAAGLLGFAAGLAAGAAVPRSKGREVCHRGSILDDLTEAP